MNLSVEDLENLQLILQEKQLDYKLELVDGKIQVMGLSDYISEVIIARLVFLLQSWVLPRQLGYVTGSSAGFRLPNGNLRGPDVSFVSAARLNPLPRSFAEIVPDLMVEVKSASDSIPPLQKKIQMFLELGTQVGILIDPDKLTVTVYRSTGEAIVLSENNTMTIPELFPGWELPISEIWPQVF
ncbi:Uma2 family endonuclease [Aerosakkonema sp. BLCC-F183]|uniref:Uma2 family endonuclease n=1 Tax=Aerosakkonema sp. BLCC-F183 TaxID=3342834 RepID=UPI0035B7D94C